MSHQNEKLGAPETDRPLTAQIIDLSVVAGMPPGDPLGRPFTADERKQLRSLIALAPALRAMLDAMEVLKQACPTARRELGL